MRKDITVIAAIIAALNSCVASNNAKEAHKHTHEIACYVQDDDLCKYYKADH